MQKQIDERMVSNPWLRNCPHMHSERELDACPDSLSSQTYGNLDVVVIDDGCSPMAVVQSVKNAPVTRCSF